MSSHHDDHGHSSEPKKVSFRTPQIMGFVTILLILLAVSTCDKKNHGCCEAEKAECESKCEGGAKEAHEQSNIHNAVIDTLAVDMKADTLTYEHVVADTLVKTNATHEHANH